jgi:transcriptional regulator with XRE-family HTH domain
MWANYEAGERRISLNHALALCHSYGVTLEWIYRGHTNSLPQDLAEKIRSQEMVREQKHSGEIEWHWLGVASGPTKTKQ